MMKTILILLATALTGYGASVMKMSDYPNTNSPGSNYLLVLAVPGVTNYNISFGQFTNLLQQLMVLNGSNAVRSLKQPFHTNYTLTTADDVTLVFGTNQIVTLPDCTNTATRAGRSYTVSSTNVNGSFVVTNANGLQTVKTDSWLSVTNSGAGAVTLVNAGTNWWTLQGKDS